MAKKVTTSIKSHGSYSSRGDMSSNNQTSSMKKGSKGVYTKGKSSNKVSSTKTINNTLNRSETESISIVSTKKTLGEYSVTLLQLPFWFAILFMIIAIGPFNKVTDVDGLGHWELDQNYEIQNRFYQNDIIDMQLEMPITELNNHSLREVFEDGNIANLTNNFNILTN